MKMYFYFCFIIRHRTLAVPSGVEGANIRVAVIAGSTPATRSKRKKVKR